MEIERRGIDSNAMLERVGATVEELRRLPQVEPEDVHSLDGEARGNWGLAGAVLADDDLSWRPAAGVAGGAGLRRPFKPPRA
jgi:hypothetical protein